MADKLTDNDQDEQVTGMGDEEMRGVASEDDDDFDDSEDLDDEEDEEESTTF